MLECNLLTASEHDPTGFPEASSRSSFGYRARFVGTSGRNPAALKSAAAHTTVMRAHRVRPHMRINLVVLFTFSPALRRLAFRGIVYSPSTSKAPLPSADMVPLYVPPPLRPFNLPVPLVIDHLPSNIPYDGDNRRLDSVEDTRDLGQMAKTDVSPSYPGNNEEGREDKT